MSAQMIDSTEAPCPVLFHGLEAFGIGVQCAKRSRHWKHSTFDHSVTWSAPRSDLFPTAESPHIKRIIDSPSELGCPAGSERDKEHGDK